MRGIYTTGGARGGHVMLFLLLMVMIVMVPMRAGAQEGESQLTFASGSVVTWQAPWGGPQIDGQRSVYLGNDVASGMLVSMDPASELTAEQAMMPPVEWQEIQSGSDGQGGFYYMGGMPAIDLSGNEAHWLVFRRTWTTPDGQWTIVTQLDSLLPNLEQDLANVKRFVTIDGQPIWSDVDPATLASNYYAWAGVEPAGVPDPASQPAETSSSSAPAGSSVQMADSVTLEFGSSVAWSDFWAVDPDFTATNYVTLTAPAGFLRYFVQDYRAELSLEDTWATTRDAFGQGAVLIDEGQAPDGGYYGIWTATMDDGSVVYIMARAMYAPGTTTPTSTGFYAVDYLMDPMLLGMRQVEINGEPAWADVNDTALLDIFQSGGPTGEALFISSGVSAQQQSVEDEEPEDPAPSDDVDTTNADDQEDDPTPSRNRDVEDESEQSPSRSSDDETGLIEDTAYVSELFGYTVEWDDTWEAGDDAVTSDDEYDSLTITTGDAGVGAVNVWGAEWDGSLSIDDVIDYWTSDDYLEEYQPDDTEVILADSRRNSGAVVLVGPYSDDDPEIWVTVMEITLLDDDIEVETTLVAPLDDFEDVYDDAQGAIELDGDEVIGFFSTDEIVEELPADE